MNIWKFLWGNKHWTIFILLAKKYHWPIFVEFLLTILNIGLYIEIGTVHSASPKFASDMQCRSDATENFYVQSNGSSRQSIFSSILPVVFGVQLLYMRFTFYCPGGMHIAAWLWTFARWKYIYYSWYHVKLV